MRRTSRWFSSTVSDQTARRVLRMTGLPKGWMHDDIVQFVEIIAKRIQAPIPPSDEAASSSSTLASSPFVRRVRIPFGRRTGVLFGEPTIELTSNEVTDALLELDFSQFEDSRRRLGFEEVPLEEVLSREAAPAARRIEEEEEDRHALATMSLDRYLMDPDVLFDMKKMRQKRLLTNRGRIGLESFRSNEDSEIVEDQSANKDDGSPIDIGRGSMQNVGIPQPYIQGRRGY